MIITITLNPSLDLNIYVDKLRKNQNNRTNGMKYDIGGKATHVSLVLSALGVENIATGIMAGNNGQTLVNMMKNRNVECDYVFQDGDETRITYIVVQEEEEGTFMLTHTGFPISDETIENLFNKIKYLVRPKDYVVISGGIPAGIDVIKYGNLLKLIKDLGGILVVDTSKECLREAIKYNPFLLKPNELEIEELLGYKPADEKEYIKEIKKLNQNGIEIVALSLGEKGSIISTIDETIKIIPPNIIQVNDTGCGDVFLGGAIGMLYKQKSLIESFKYATAISASKATKMGTSEFCMDQTIKLLEEVKISVI